MNAVACHFEGHDCNHSTLFRNEYKRTNRNKQTKILRCFPHCCPEHLNRSYCGSSLCVKVEIVRPDSPEAQTADVVTGGPTSLLLFAHFELAQANVLSLNDQLDYDEVASSIQTEKTPKGKWIQGVVKHKTSTTERSCVFLLNPGARWYYEWESAATKAQRFTKHVLRAYIFQRASESRLRVVGLASSSEFMVMSYRRAPTEVRAEREAMEALRVDAAKFDSSKEVNVNVKAMTSFENSSQAARLLRLDGCENEVWQDRKMWECRHPDIMVSSKQLVIVSYFVHFIDISAFGACLKQWSQLYSDQTEKYSSFDWKSEASQHAAPFSWDFLGPLHHSPTNYFHGENKTDSTQCDPLSRLVHTCSGLVGWLILDSANLQLYRRFLRYYSLGLLDKSRVRYGYVEAIKLMRELVDQFTGKNEDLSSSSSSSSSLSLLSEEIMTVVFKYDHLKPLRRILMDILSSNTMFGMHEFVAQLRAQFIFQQRQSMSTRNVIIWRQRHQASIFGGTWAFNGQHSSITPIQDSHGLRISLACLLEFMRELAQITIRTVDDQTLEIISAWNACSTAERSDDMVLSARAGMTLVLDSRPRVFSNFPSGLSSSIALGSHSYGDYRGKIMSPSHFVLEMSSWPVDSSRRQPALRWKLQIRISQSQPHNDTSNSKGLVIDAVAEEGVWQVDSKNQVPDFLGMSFVRKQQTVEAWYPVYEMKGVYDHCVGVRDCLKK